MFGNCFSTRFLKVDWDSRQASSFYATQSYCHFTLIFRLAPESPRWLLMKNRTDEAVKELSRIAKINKIKTDYKGIDMTHFYL